MLFGTYAHTCKAIFLKTIILFLWKILGLGVYVDKKEQEESLPCVLQDFFKLVNDVILIKKKQCF